MLTWNFQNAKFWVHISFLLLKIGTNYELSELRKDGCSIFGFFNEFCNIDRFVYQLINPMFKITYSENWGNIYKEKFEKL